MPRGTKRILARAVTVIAVDTTAAMPHGTTQTPAVIGRVVKVVVPRGTFWNLRWCSQREAVRIGLSRLGNRAREVD